MNQRQRARSGPSEPREMPGPYGESLAHQGLRAFSSRTSLGARFAPGKRSATDFGGGRPRRCRGPEAL